MAREVILQSVTDQAPSYPRKDRKEVFQAAGEHCDGETSCTVNEYVNGRSGGGTTNTKGGVRRGRQKAEKDVERGREGWMEGPR